MPEKKTDRLYIRTTYSMKTALQKIAKRDFKGNMNAAIDKALEDFIMERTREEDEE